MTDFIRKELHNGEAIRFGRGLFLHFAVFMSVAICLCLKTASPSRSIIGLCAFLALRAFAGGMHLGNKAQCLFFSFLILYILFFLEPSISVLTFTSISFAVWLMSPVVHPCRPLSVRGRMKAKLICATILFWITSVAVCFRTLYPMMANVVALTLCLQILGYVKVRIGS